MGATKCSAARRRVHAAAGVVGVALGSAGGVGDAQAVARGVERVGDGGALGDGAAGLGIDAGEPALVVVAVGLAAQLQAVGVSQALAVYQRVK
jgi:hypothetical protein